MGRIRSRFHGGGGGGGAAGVGGAGGVPGVGGQGIRLANAVPYPRRRRQFPLPHVQIRQAPPHRRMRSRRRHRLHLRREEHLRPSRFRLRVRIHGMLRRRMADRISGQINGVGALLDRSQQQRVEG